MFCSAFVISVWPEQISIRCPTFFRETENLCRVKAWKGPFFLHTSSLLDHFLISGLDAKMKATPVLLLVFLLAAICDCDEHDHTVRIADKICTCHLQFSSVFLVCRWRGSGCVDEHSRPLSQPAGNLWLLFAAILPGPKSNHFSLPRNFGRSLARHRVGVFWPSVRVQK